MGGVAHIDKRRISDRELSKWLREHVPLYFNYGNKAVAYTWSPESLARDLRAYLLERPQTTR